MRNTVFAWRIVYRNLGSLWPFAYYLPYFSQKIEEGLLVCRWLRTQGKLEEASGQLEHLLAVTRQVGQSRLMLEIQVEMVLVAAASKRKEEAQDLLRDVLA